MKSQPSSCFVRLSDDVILEAFPPPSDVSYPEIQPLSDRTVSGRIHPWLSSPLLPPFTTSHILIAVQHFSTAATDNKKAAMIRAPCIHLSFPENPWNQTSAVSQDWFVKVNLGHVQTQNAVCYLHLRKSYFQSQVTNKKAESCSRLDRSPC